MKLAKGGQLMISQKSALTREILITAIDEAVSVVRRNMEKWGNEIPVYADAGVYKIIDLFDLEKSLGNKWYIGCGPGLYWLCYHYTGDEAFKTKALYFAENFDKVPRLPSQCQGILYMPLCVPAVDICQSQKAKDILMEAAEYLYSMFVSNGSYFMAWRGIKNFAVDSIINITLMHWASQATGDSKYFDAALRHIDTEIKNIMRPDGSTYHLIWLDTAGDFERFESNQARTDDSCWARGQAWAMYGMAMFHRYTRSSQYLACFKKLAAYFFDNLNDNMISCCDLYFKNTSEPVDTSASAIAVCAVLEMAKQLPDDKDIAKFASIADGVMLSLIKNYSVAYDNYIDALILGGTDNIRQGWYDEALIFGDYFYMEALVRYLTDYDSCWK